MEIALVIIAILALVGGSAVLVSRQGWLPAGFPILRAWGVATELVETPDGAAERAIGPGPEPLLLGAQAAAHPSVARDQAKPAETPPEPIRLDLMPATGEVGLDRLDRIEGRLDQLQRAVVRQNELFAAETRRITGELAGRAELEEARRDAAQERMRADVLAVVTRVVAERQPGGGARRMEVSADLYAQLARFEAALATVTNPILLPGEPYAPPSELAAESLVWENWNEVGERAFALAEIYSAQRLHLSAQTRGDVGEFVTTLRTLLTRSIYPNLQSETNGGRQAALRDALAEIADLLPSVRDVLETEYLEGRTG